MTERQDTGEYEFEGAPDRWHRYRWWANGRSRGSVREDARRGPRRLSGCGHWSGGYALAGRGFTNLDALSHVPESARLLQQLGSIARLITFDPRGTGLSDRIFEQQLPTLETRMADAVAVMDAVGSTRTALLGHDATGPLAILFAATYPERTSALILYSTYASGRWSPDYPWAWSEEKWDASLKEMDERWGGPAYTEEYDLLSP